MWYDDRHRDNCLERRAYYPQFPQKKGACHAMQDHMGKPRVSQEAERAKEKHGPEPLLWFSGKGTGKVG